MDTLGAIIGPLTALGLLAALPGNYRTAFAVTLLPGLVAATLIGLVVQERERAPASHPSFSERLGLLPSAYRRLLLAVGIFGAGASAHTLLILLATQRLTPSLGASAAATVAVALYVLHNVFYAGFSYLGGLLADRFPKNRLLAGGYALAALMALGIMFLPVGLGPLALVFILGSRCRSDRKCLPQDSNLANFENMRSEYSRQPKAVSVRTPTTEPRRPH
jgi:predicted MFS family arabinose efflux permease